MMRRMAEIESREGEPIKVTKLHFLIHPGFIAHEHRRKLTAIEPDDLYSSLLASYKELAKSMGPTELMCLVSHVPNKDLQRMKSGAIAGESYKTIPLQVIEELKADLGERLIVLSKT